MKMRIALLTLLCLALVAVPAFAQEQEPWSYDNGPINGTTDAWTINFGYVVSDTFFNNAYVFPTVTGFQIGTWEFPGDTLSSVDWSITSDENAPCPSDLCIGSGTARNLFDQFISTNQFGYDIDLITVRGLYVEVPGHMQLWLNLANASVPSGDPVYWDENSGVGCGGSGGGANCPSLASESSVGTIPSEAFTITGYYEVYTPEPGSFLLFGSGVLGLVGALRGKLKL